MNSQKAQPKTDNTEAKKLIGYFSDLFFDRFAVKPAVSFPQCISMINRLLKQYDFDTLKGVVDLYFQHEKDKVYHLPSILSAWAINKYLPKLGAGDRRLYVE